MNNIRQPAIGLMILMVFVGLLTIIYGGLENDYGITTSSEMLDDEGQNMAVALSKLNLINKTVVLSENIVGIVTPSNPFDVLGSLAASGIGILQLMYDITTYPVSIINVIVVYYGGLIPPPIEVFARVILIVTIAFIILSVLLKRDV